MGVIFVKDPQTGIDYSVNIAGSSPTESEKSRINKFLSDKRTQAPVVTQQSVQPCLLYTSPSPRDRTRSRMPSSA